jgi:hypothetical protein
MTIWRWLMGWFRWSSERHDAQQDRLRRAEHDEEQAMRRLVDAGVQATIRADEGREAADHVKDQFDKAKTDAERVILTAERALRLLERDQR